MGLPPIILIENEWTTFWYFDGYDNQYVCYVGEVKENNLHATGSLSRIEEVMNM